MRTMFSRIERALSRLKNAFLRPRGESSCCALLAALEHARSPWRTYDGHFRFHPEAVMAEDRDRE
jgi:hypothetical protein